MQIRLRPSGGRGEYELAGSHGGIRVSDLFGLELWFDFGFDLRVPLNATADVHDGKPRIRLGDPHADSHAALLLAAILLLPPPIREIRKTAGNATNVDLSRCAYSAIAVDIVEKTPFRVVLRPRNIIAKNNDNAQLGIDVLNRFEGVQWLWGMSIGAPKDTLIAAHRDACVGATFDHRKLLRAATEVLKALLPGEVDSLMGAMRSPSEFDSETFTVQATAPAEDDPTSPIEVNRELRRRQIWLADRGPDGRRFRQLIGVAYDYRCAFTGLRLPPLGKGFSPGVDAAHIFPWSQQGSNVVSNGIGLSKQMHWALDEGILRLDYDPAASEYVIAVPDGVHKLAKTSKFDLSPFLKVCGPIPVSNLPPNPLHLPSLQAIAKYNALMFPSL